MKEAFKFLFLFCVLFGSQVTLAAPIVPGSFSTTWQTDNPGTTASNQIRIPTTGAGYNYNIYWEDLASSTINGTLTGRTGVTTITFPAPGTYRVDITGTFPRIYFNGGGDRQKILTVEQWGNIAWTSMELAFRGASNLRIPATDAPNFAGVTSLQWMFLDVSSMNDSIDHWDVSTVTNMNSMFSGASSFNQPLNGWNVSNVTTMVNMFRGASSFNQPLDQWNISNVLSLSYMFQNATAFNQPLNNWNVSNVNNVSGMFSGASSFNQPLDQWSLPATASLHNIFENSSFNQNFTTWTWLYNPARTSWGGLLKGANAFTQDISQLSLPSNITDLSSFFALNSTFNQDISAWDVSHVTNMDTMFWGATAFNQPLNDWNVSSVTIMQSMFQDASIFNQPLSNWDVSNVTDMSTMFQNAVAFNQPLNTWNVSQVSDMDSMFEMYDANPLFDQDLSDWDISNVVGMYDIFDSAPLSINNYTNMLSGWSQQILQTNAGFGYVGLSSGRTPYCANAQAARDVLTNTYSWSITDGGSVPCFTLSYAPGTNAVLIGNGTQLVVGGTDGASVEVIPDSGYRFMMWSDGRTDNPRSDLNASSSIIVSAILVEDASAIGRHTDSTATKIGERVRQELAHVTSTPTTTKSVTRGGFIASVRELIAYLEKNEDELDEMTPEELKTLTYTLRDIILYLISWLPGV